jgi:hypothetical protein
MVATATAHSQVILRAEPIARIIELSKMGILSGTFTVGLSSAAGIHRDQASMGNNVCVLLRKAR